MRKLLVALGAISIALPAAAVMPAASAAPVAKAPTAATAYDQRRNKRQAYREWRGRDGRRYCRKPDGTTGLVVGAVGGALVGRTIDTRGDRTAGTVLGALAGGLAGREIDRSSSKRRCR
ncbi:MAG: glycine zipper 2TM domain-containing protein [Sphingomonadales bacterium]|nr:MAG: glycine zipper 2TM domain-containing protein [Sphingomonadales bacterium]